MARGAAGVVEDGPQSLGHGEDPHELQAAFGELRALDRAQAWKRVAHPGLDLLGGDDAGTGQQHRAGDQTGARGRNRSSSASEKLKPVEPLLLGSRNRYCT